MTSAAQVVLDYLAQRNRVRQTIAVYIGAGLRAQSFDDHGGTRSFCFVHGDDVTSCFAHDRCALHRVWAEKCCEIKTPCQGEPIAKGDPTGEAALTPDPFAGLLTELDRWEQRLSRDYSDLLGRPVPLASVAVLLRHTVDPPPASVRGAAHVFTRALTLCVEPARPPKGYAHDGAPGCGSCARLKTDDGPWWSEPTYYSGKPVDLGGILKAKTRLCRVCQAWIVEHDRLPTTEELRHRHDDPRGRWPRRTVKHKAAS